MQTHIFLNTVTGGRVNAFLHGMAFPKYEFYAVNSVICVAEMSNLSV